MDDHSVLAVSSDFSIYVLTITEEENTISIYKKPIPVVDHCVGCSHVHGKVSFEPNQQLLTYINNYNQISSVHIISRIIQSLPVYSVSSFFTHTLGLFSISEDQHSFYLNGEELLFSTVCTFLYIQSRIIPSVRGVSQTTTVIC